MYSHGFGLFVFYILIVKKFLNGLKQIYLYVIVPVLRGGDAESFFE